jgi:DNA-directed RNA polymerase subunit M/transcription elongation factor TFIIS
MAADLMAGGRRMEPQKHATAARSCPQCGSPDYQFRGRKKLPADPGKGEPAGWETKYRCKACAKEWKVRTPA